MGQRKYRIELIHETYAYLAGEMNKAGIAYVHIASNQNQPKETVKAIRTGFTNTLISSSGFTPETAEAALQEGLADLIAFGRSFLANPDFVQRITKGVPLNAPDYQTLYTPGPVGYTDYSVVD